MWAVLACPVPLRTLKSIPCSFKLWGNDMLLMSMNLPHSQMCFQSSSLLKWKQERYAFLKRRLFSGHECLFDRMPPLIWKAVQSPTPQIASSSVLAKVISSYFLFRDLKKENGQCPNMFSSHITKGQGRVLSGPVMLQIILLYPSFLYVFHIVSVC